MTAILLLRIENITKDHREDEGPHMSLNNIQESFRYKKSAFRCYSGASTSQNPREDNDSE
jgi:hypothetical protein